MKLDLAGHLEEVEEFHETEVFERIEKWYHGDPDERVEATGWDAPPHTFMGERAAELIRFGLEIWDDHYRRSGMSEYPPVADTQDILLLVGTETLLTGIVMQEETEWFINYCKDRNQTPSFGRIVEEKLPEWIGDLSETQQERVMTVLRTLKAHRNNLVHFGLHQMRHNPDYPAYYDVLAYLFVEYFDRELAVVDELRERVDRNQRIQSNVEYQWLCFEFTDD